MGTAALMEVIFAVMMLREIFTWQGIPILWRTSPQADIRTILAVPWMLSWQSSMPMECVSGLLTMAVLLWTWEVLVRRILRETFTCLGRPIPIPALHLAGTRMFLVVLIMMPSWRSLMPVGCCNGPPIMVGLLLRAETSVLLMHQGMFTWWELR